ncbi:hypothetical protein [Dickeya lacustris]|uniref:Uncharacterized protein n=1 Tax=Dickeya lacustris TaxID=2259638 RepID=A0ABY8G4E6_9GAMM|nr:hypothetical protein [Dickeya lacustris]WFN54836.1 hypothetical protein O1Q98_14410 [Dickeya lacustris]
MNNKVVKITANLTCAAISTQRKREKHRENNNKKQSNKQNPIRSLFFTKKMAQNNVPF